MRSDYDGKRFPSESFENEYPSTNEDQTQSSDFMDFPTLQESSPSTKHSPADPSRIRFSNAVKFGRPSTPTNRSGLVAAMKDRNAHPPVQPRPSPRVNLRPPALLPTVKMGAEMNVLYMRYRETFLELGALRNKLLSRAADAWAKGGGFSLSQKL
jgi:hypothetical protein